MPAPDILGIQAFDTGSIFHEWWQWALVAIISASGLWELLRSFGILIVPCGRC
jgi:hypothetical protein